MKIINLYIVDESPMTAKRIKNGVDGVQGIKVIGTGRMRDFMNYRQAPAPDLVLSNIFMGGLQARSFIKYVISDKRIPFVALVNDPQQAKESLLMGVTDCIVKNMGIIDDNILRVAATKLRLAYNRLQSTNPLDKILNDASGVSNLSGVIAIGASTGGTEATLNVLTKLPRQVPGIVVTQHMLDKFIGIYAQRLNRLCALEVKEAQDNEYIRPGTVLIAPGDKHMTVKKVGNNYLVRCFKGAQVSGHCPSVDVLFDSVATSCGRNAVGIILTGMGEDGAKGLKKMHDAGAFTIGQSQEGCCVYGMPQKAYELGGVTVQRPLNLIPGELMNYLRRRK